ncbi:alpha-ketoglutarate-dependent dioxygenase AlkB [Jannaschia sp. R86511]|uniref:alpha-ketoglutarate-dependent dioxygenase AlkB n=1 Tax=Jannaschia sp. R86511 TaxID=3093853 RepID=UPI0036D362E0
MEIALQPSLFDDVDATAQHAGPSLGDLGGTVQRTVLSGGAWVDVRPGWVSDSAEVFSRLVERVPWVAEKRQMYDRVVDVPRLLSWYGEHDAWPDPLLADARDALTRHYGAGERERFVSAGLCFYRDGRDGVAWHGDRIGRSRSEDVMVAIVSFGAPRALLLRPVGGGETVRHVLGHGDLLVMGGSCQRTWDHSVPKTARAVGPRISVQLRPRGVA